jgi:hypothetical protein
MIVRPAMETAREQHAFAGAMMRTADFSGSLRKFTHPDGLLVHEGDGLVE